MYHQLICDFRSRTKTDIFISRLNKHSYGCGKIESIKSLPITTAEKCSWQREIMEFRITEGNQDAIAITPFFTSFCGRYHKDLEQFDNPLNNNYYASMFQTL